MTPNQSLQLSDCMATWQAEKFGSRSVCMYLCSLLKKDLTVRNFIPDVRPGAKTIKKNTNSTQNKYQTHRAKQYEVTSFLSTDWELSTDTCSKNVYGQGSQKLYNSSLKL